MENPTCPTVVNGKDGQVGFHEYVGTQVLYNGIPNCPTVDNDMTLASYASTLEPLEQITDSECRPQLQVEMSSSSSGNNSKMKYIDNYTVLYLYCL